MPETIEEGFTGEETKKEDIEIYQKVFIKELKVKNVKTVNASLLGSPRRIKHKPRPLLVRVEVLEVRVE